MSRYNSKTNEMNSVSCDACGYVFECFDNSTNKTYPNNMFFGEARSTRWARRHRAGR